MEQKNLQRLTVYLKSGQTITVDFDVAESNKVTPQIELLTKNFTNPDAQNKAVVFEGKRLIGIRVSEVAAYEVQSFILTPKAEEEKAEGVTKQ